MDYCKYCYRILEDGCAICPSCGKSQVGSVKRQKKFLGLIPIYREKDLNKAKDISYHANASYQLAKESPTILEFTLFWKMLISDLATLRTYRDLVSPDNFSEFEDLLLWEEEFQWRLRDAIDRSTENTLSDMKGEYRNNIEGRAQAFADDIHYANDLADLETAKFILTKIYEVADYAKIEIPSRHLQKTCSQPLNESAKHGDIDAELMTVDLMEGHDFEYWCADLLRKIGYANVEVTRGSGDQGVDIIAEKDGIRYAIQCKCYSSDLGNSPVQEVSAGRMMPQYHCQVGAVMTNRHFTKGAQELAAATGTLLWDRDWLIDALDKINK